MPLTDKLNHIDYNWYIVRTKPGHEKELCSIIECCKSETKNILEAYCPTHTTVNVYHGGNERRMPLFDGYVFVLATQKALADFIRDKYPNASIRYNRKQAKEDKATFCTIPEVQMKAFMDFNENYADKVVVLERPYADYAKNPNEHNIPNEIVRVLDGPLAGCEGYVCRFRRKRGLVFEVQGVMPGSHLTVYYPNIYDLHVVRLHNAEGDRLSMGTEKDRAADLLVGVLQAYGCGKRTLPMLHDIIERLAANLSLTSLCLDLHKQNHKALSHRLAEMTNEEAGLLLNLARYEHDNNGYVRKAYCKLIIRPFLTPTSGIDMEGKGEITFKHDEFTEIIRRVDISEEIYYPSKKKSAKVAETYYAHIGIVENHDSEEYTLFANWDNFLGEYFLTSGKANEQLVKGTVKRVACATQGACGSSTINGKLKQDEKEKLIESFRNFSPTLYKTLTDESSPLKAISGFKIGDNCLNVFAIKSKPKERATATDTLIHTCISICTEINTTNHLALWRRYLQTVWLHK